ncbi:uncharacterized protein LOC126837663 isoform X2 [Adelges cooleyi]|uniref:uncharacterized protein LOC126837663 isoform X2 n=1 Tax=Adelges cooleyi TaxID=133065 RepID=UPI00218065BA|nr:uncharacterized protein LOC126837663 isoform X2 [Adelges cooleyi]
MKYFCFLILFLFVNVSADDLRVYADMVRRINIAIEKAFNVNNLTIEDNPVTNALEYVIEAIFDDNYYNGDFATMNFMIARPDQIEIVAHIPVEPANTFENEIKKAMHYQYLMEVEVRAKLSPLYVTIHYSHIKRDQDSRDIDLTALAEPRRRLVKTVLKNIISRALVTMVNQFMKQPEIRDPSTDKVKDLGRLNLTTVAEKRRVTGTSLENTMRQALLDKTLWRICCMIGIYMSTRLPTSYIKNIHVESNMCTLYDGITQQRYQQINGVLWQIGLDNRRAQLFEEQLI